MIDVRPPTKDPASADSAERYAASCIYDYYGSATRKDKEAYFEKAVQLLAPITHQVLTEMNARLLLDRERGGSKGFLSKAVEMFLVARGINAITSAGL